MESGAEHVVHSPSEGNWPLAEVNPAAPRPTPSMKAPEPMGSVGHSWSAIATSPSAGLHPRQHHLARCWGSGDSGHPGSADAERPDFTATAAGAACESIMRAGKERVGLGSKLTDASAAPAVSDCKEQPNGARSATNACYEVECVEAPKPLKLRTIARLASPRDTKGLFQVVSPWRASVPQPSDYTPLLSQAVSDGIEMTHAECGGWGQDAKARPVPRTPRRVPPCPST